MDNPDEKHVLDEDEEFKVTLEVTGPSPRSGSHITRKKNLALQYRQNPRENQALAAFLAYAYYNQQQQPASPRSNPPQVPHAK